MSNCECRSNSSSGTQKFTLYNPSQITLSNCSFGSVEYSIINNVISTTTFTWNMDNFVGNSINTLRIYSNIFLSGYTNNTISCLSCENNNVTFNLNNYPLTSVIFKPNNCKLENCICSNLSYEIKSSFGIENCSCSSATFKAKELVIANLSKCSNITFDKLTVDGNFSKFFTSMLSTSTLGLVNVKFPSFWNYVSSLASQNYAFDNNVLINNTETANITLSKDSAVAGVFKNSVIVNQPSILSVDFRGWKPSDVNGLNNGLFLNIASEAANDKSFTLRVDNANDWVGYKNKIYAFGAAGTNRVIITDQ